MLKRLSLLEMYSARVRGVKFAAVLALCLVAPGTAWGQCLPLAPHVTLACRFDATLTRMFTPRTVPQGIYRVFVTPEPLERVTAAFRAGASSADVEGAWVVSDMDPLDAYGTAGPYDRAKVARLYVGKRAKVARGPVIADGQTVASITLVSPYPDGTLARLEPGTLIILFRIPPPGGVRN